MRMCFEHSADRIMNSSYEQEPFSLSEFAAGSIAVAAVALIAYLGANISQPPNPPPARPSQSSPPQAPPLGPSAEVSQQRRRATTAMAPTPSNLLLEGVMVRRPESSDPDPAASDVPAARPRGTKVAPASNFFIEAAPGAIVELQRPDAGSLPPPLIGPLDLLRTKDAISVQPSKPTRVAITQPAEAERNPSNHSDALWIQTRLRDLGYYAGATNGIWGAASRDALRDFKAMNDLQEDDKRDQGTQQRLLSKQNVRASSTFIGSWADDVDKCPGRQGSGAPLIIRSRGAVTDGGKCDFREVKREAATRWRIQAACSVEGQSWNANISLKLTRSNLNWSSERGTQTYVRCLKP
jgi:hypothetical protein